MKRMALILVPLLAVLGCDAATAPSTTTNPWGGDTYLDVVNYCQDAGLSGCAETVSTLRDNGCNPEGVLIIVDEIEQQSSSAKAIYDKVVAQGLCPPNETPETAAPVDSTTTTPSTTESAPSTTIIDRPTTSTDAAAGTWDSTEDALRAMIDCGDTGPCEIEWPSDQQTAQELPDSIPGYEPTGETERSELRVLGDGTASMTAAFPYLLGDCASQIWTARWRSVTGESISGAVIPATPEAPLDQPWNPAWGDPPTPSKSGFLAGFGCSQPAWTWMDEDPEFVIIADGIVEWQIWLAAP